jgi:anthranilate phosphoribosyltransferase
MDQMDQMDSALVSGLERAAAAVDTGAALAVLERWVALSRSISAVT